MTAAASPRFEHGSALRVPAAHDKSAWRKLEWWLGECGRKLDPPGHVAVETPEGWFEAGPGDWIVLSVTGRYYVAASAG